MGNRAIARTLVIFIAVVAGNSVALVRTMQSTPGGGATISGVVTTADEPATAIARARVVLVKIPSEGNRATFTDESGRFSFANVSLGKYYVSASKAGYPIVYYPGPRSPVPAPTISVADDKAQEELIIKLVRGAAISGFVRDAGGRPVAAVPVMTLRRGSAGVGNFSKVPDVMPAYSDMQGAYRVWDLPPGDYLLMIPGRMNMLSDKILPTTQEDVERARQILSGRGSAVEPPAASNIAFNNTFYPGTASESDATPVRVNSGDERTGIDFVLSSQPVFRITGVVSDPLGRTLGSIRMWAQAVGRTNVTYLSVGIEQGRDGAFTIPNVFPGHYIVQARAIPGGPDAGPTAKATHWARADIANLSSNMTGLVLTLQPTLTISGRITFDADATSAPPALDAIRISMREADVSTWYETPQAATKADGSFVVEGVSPARYMIGAGAPAGWILKSIRGSGAIDFADVPFEVAASGETAPLVITFTKRTTELKGTLLDATGKPPNAYTIIAFSADKTYWTAGTRRIQAARPQSDGTYTFANLPAGSYLLAAVTGVEDRPWLDPAWLSGLVINATRVTIPDGGKVVQDLRVGK